MIKNTLIMIFLMIINSSSWFLGAYLINSKDLLNPNHWYSIPSTLSIFGFMFLIMGYSIVCFVDRFMTP